MTLIFQRKLFFSKFFHPYSEIYIMFSLEIRALKIKHDNDIAPSQVPSLFFSAKAFGLQCLREAIQKRIFFHLCL